MIHIISYWCVRSGVHFPPRRTSSRQQQSLLTVERQARLIVDYIRSRFRSDLKRLRHLWTDLRKMQIHPTWQQAEPLSWVWTHTHDRTNTLTVIPELQREVMRQSKSSWEQINISRLCTVDQVSAAHKVSRLKRKLLFGTAFLGWLLPFHSILYKVIYS